MTVVVLGAGEGRGPDQGEDRIDVFGSHGGRPLDDFILATTALRDAKIRASFMGGCRG